MVVVKLFLIELLNAGGLPRVVSFTGVGLLLLLIAYFAPLPPKRGDKVEYPAVLGQHMAGTTGVDRVGYRGEGRGPEILDLTQ